MEQKRNYADVRFQDNGKLKLLIIVGTRPEIIRLSAVIKKCRQYFDCILAHTGQNYDYNLNGVFFHDLGLDDPEVYMDAVGDDLGATIGNIIDRIVHGYVVDMFDLQLFSYPVFNLADCCVVVGAILGGVYYLFLYEKYDKKKKESDHAHDPSDPS